MVLGRLVERDRRHERPRLHERDAGRTAADPNYQHERRTGVRCTLPVLPGRPVPVPPPAVQLLRQLRARHARPGAPPGRGRVRAARRSPPTRTCNLKDVSFIKPIGEENEHPGYASEHAGSTHLVDLLQSIEGSACAKDTMVDRHLRRVRRSVGSRLAAGPGQRQRPARRLGPGHADPGARARAAPEGRLRRRQHRARHDLDPGHDRAPLRARIRWARATRPCPTCRACSRPKKPKHLSRPTARRSLRGTTARRDRSRRSDSRPPFGSVARKDRPIVCSPTPR